MGIERLNDFMTTEKQRGFETDFRLETETYEVWDEIEVGRVATAKQTFVVKEQDILSYNFPALEDDPLFVDPQAARAAGLDQVIAHPLFAVQIAFYCIEKGPGNWLRSPGARNPGQKLIFHEPFRVGDEITLTITCQDKWVRRNKYYLQDRYDYHNQEGTLKAVWYATLILPPSRAELARFAAQ
ncbi:MAG: MaoC family dehydratase [Alphaproteobacteria bacterium]|nr:MaoC family dehydratase [Alphaproteobacteria bacterium]